MKIDSNHRNFRRTLAGGLLLAAAFAAHAHHVWLEPDGEANTLYFGEFGGNLRETSPGLLDKFVKPTAHKQQGQTVTPLELGKTPKGFVIQGTLKSGEALIAEEASYPITERKQGEQLVRSIYQPAARLSTDGAAQPPQLTLDLVPTGKTTAEGIEVRAVYRGKPLAKAKVEVVTPSGWGQTHQTDADGLLNVSLPWQGTYVFELSHADTSGVERDGKKLDRASYVTSLTLLRKQGLPALPAVAPAPPNKAN
jgi:uncharacterized GH25 family protein